MSRCQHMSELFPDFMRVRLMLANLRGEFCLDRIAPTAGANKSESLEYFNALASPNIKVILRNPFDIAAERVAM